MVKLNFNLVTKSGTQSFDYEVSKVICVGFAGRNKDAVMAHVKELEEIGVKGPEKVPTLYPIADLMITQDDKIQVIGNETCGEIEFAILEKDGELYIGLCSDHTDRSLETVSIEKSKQVCPKPIAKTLWKYDEVKSHWDDLILRSIMTVDGEEKLYQDGKIDAILTVEDIVKEVKEAYGDISGLVIYSGTIATNGGLIYGEKFSLELEDPVLGRKISHTYNIEDMLKK